MNLVEKKDPSKIHDLENFKTRISIKIGYIYIISKEGVPLHHKRILES